MEKSKKNKNRKAVDFTLLLGVLLLVFIGIIMVFSSSWPEALTKHNDGYLFLRKQIYAAIAGLIAMVFCMNFNYNYYKKLAIPIYIMSIISGLLIFTPLGIEIKGARRWIDLGFTTIMPSDIIKLGSIIFFAWFLTNKKDKIGTFFQGTIPSLMYIGISCGLIFAQNDLGTTVTLAATMMGMFFIAGMRWVDLVAMGAGAYGLVSLAIYAPGKGHRLERITAYKDPFADKMDTGWQAVNSLYALGSGGIFGLGLGKSRQKFTYIPEAYNDFIFAIIGEELGLFGTILVLLLFMLVIWRGIVIALKIDDLFGSLLATGIVALITVQSLMNIGVVTSSLPTTGITLPFISYGGTSLVMFMAAIGILLNISRFAKLDRS